MNLFFKYCHKGFFLLSYTGKQDREFFKRPLFRVNVTDITVQLYSK